MKQLQPERRAVVAEQRPFGTKADVPVRVVIERGEFGRQNWRLGLERFGGEPARAIVQALNAMFRESLVS